MDKKTLLSIVGIVGLFIFLGVQNIRSFDEGFVEGVFVYEAPRNPVTPPENPESLVSTFIPEMGNMGHGEIRIYCIHRDVKGNIWSDY